MNPGQIPGPAGPDPLHWALDGVRLIEASAGTGKTYAICALYLRLLIESELGVERILVVTFTRAATAELRSRIRSRLAELLAHLDGTAPSVDPLVLGLATLGSPGEGGEARIARLREALQRFDEAAIFTIHGYCQRALAETPFAAGLPFALELVEDDEALRAEVTRDFWRRTLSEDDTLSALAPLFETQGDSPERWAALLGRVMARPLARLCWPSAEPGAAERPSAEALGDALQAARRAWGEDGKEVLATLDEGRSGLNRSTYSDAAIEAAVAGWRALLAAADPLAVVGPDKARLELLTTSVLQIRTNKGKSTPQHPFFDAAEGLLALRGRHAAWAEGRRLALLRRFIEEAAVELRRRKLERRVIAFDDILRNIHDALASGRQPWLAGALRQRYPVALIDEFQDTDPLQFDIFRRIYGATERSRRGRLLLVGDPKQAIYSFRNADLYAYLDAREATDARYTLAHNQRSDAGLIRACNALFETNPEAFVLPGLRFAPVALGVRPRQPFVDDGAPMRSPLCVWWAPQGEDGAPLPHRDLMQRAARATAAEIARLLRDAATGRVTIGARALAAADIAVLVKTHRQGARMREALSTFGIGSVELSQSSVYHSAEAEELERVLLAVAEPSRVPLLLAACATVLMGAVAGDLEALGQDDVRLAERMARFAELRELWLTRGVGVALRHWMVQDEVSARLLRAADGERRLTNLLHLIELLHEAAATRPAPDALLRWFAARRGESGKGEAAQLRLESDRNLVRIVTIHRSKGLEYGVVFCPFLFDGRSQSPQEVGLRIYHEPGSVTGDESGTENPTHQVMIDFRPEAAEDDAIKARLREARDAEEVRLIYVALTRAVHRCYVVAGLYGRPTRSGLSVHESTRSPLNWLVAGAGSAPREWRERRLDPEQVSSAWCAFAERVGSDLSLVELPVGGPDGGSWSGMPDPVRCLNARRLTHPVPSGWRIGSFSALQHGAQREEAARDRDARAAGWPPPAAVASLSEPADADDFLGFPRGTWAGECLHAVFERIEFAQPSGHAKAIDAALAAYPMRGEADRKPVPPARLRRMLESMLTDVLATELVPDAAAPLRLSSLPAERCAVELGFHLPAAGLTATALNDWLLRHGYVTPRLVFGGLSGYLKGYIDLVFEHAGRYYVLDWKSNHLGFALEDYAPARLEEVMQAHGYHLQHLLYGLALHRHLVRTLPGYDYRRDFGGAFYLFVRGVRPRWLVDGRPAGVWFHRAPENVMASLDRLIAGREAG